MDESCMLDCHRNYSCIHYGNCLFQHFPMQPSPVCFQQNHSGRWTLHQPYYLLVLQCCIQHPEWRIFGRASNSRRLCSTITYSLKDLTCRGLCRGSLVSYISFDLISWTSLYWRNTISVCVTSILRITTLDIATSAKDTTWNSIASSMWTVIESNLGIICACLPALRKPLSIFFPVLFGRFKTTAYGPEGKKSRKTNGIYDGSAGNSRAWSKGAPLGSHGGESTMLDDMRESQERIIDIKDEEIGIKKTTEVIVQVESPNARRTLFWDSTSKRLGLLYNRRKTSPFSQNGHIEVPNT